LGRPDASTWQKRLDEWIADIVNDLATEFPDAPKLRAFIERCVSLLSQAGLSRVDSVHTLIHKLIVSRSDFALELVESGPDCRRGPLAPYIGVALFCVLAETPETGRRWSQRYLDSGDIDLQCAVGRGYSNPKLLGGALAPEDRELITRVLGSPDARVVNSAVGILATMARTSPRLAVDLLRHTNIALGAGVADNALMLLHVNGDAVFEALEEDDIRFVLGALKSFPELDGYWIETLLSALSERFPELTCAFFLERADAAAEHDENFSRMRPINYGPWVHVPLRFKAGKDYARALERVWSWMISHDASDWRFEHHASAIFEAMFLPIDEAVISFLSGKVASAGKHDLRWIASVIAHVDPDFVFVHEAFVVDFLGVCERSGAPARRKAIDALFRSTISGVRSGVPGEPFPRDLEQLAKAKEVLARQPRLSPAYELYDLIRESAERNIDLQKQEAEFFDDA
jgi:hypothetical protein